MPSAELDPIAAALAPPPNESPEERESRVLQERAAKKVSDEIDEQLNRERQQVKRQPKPLQILLLGQSESGKSTTLKNFQLMCEPKAFRAERASWRAIIQLNVIRSFRTILDALAVATNTVDLPPDPQSDSIHLDADILGLRTRLLPLIQVEEVLRRRMEMPELNNDLGRPGTPSTPSTPTAVIPFRRRAGKEIAVNSTAAWKIAFMRDPSGRESFSTQDVVDWDDPDDPGVALHERGEDMRRLWAHPTVRTILERQGIRLQESPGFFLDELDVVTSLRYVPTDDHILRARLKTLGVTEHRMRLTDPSGGTSREFRIFDVGGQRSMRRKTFLSSRNLIHRLSAKWVPYFENIDCLIFLVPISAFNEVLAEDPEVGRLVDSVELWTAISSNQLLKKSNLILFLNKVDILQSKLASGIRFSDYVPSYGRRPNDFDSASRYMRKQFGAILKESSPSPRTFYCHLTNVVDQTSTAFVLAGIKDMLLRSHLKHSGLLM
ncbi:guanine nucleotide binding protein, alpha subunit [Mycena alexandri]|uniref:Guanine nucleotide binding protein, alpha subunit n=1 Tax=Mycena alexandri TaxID=1745969 RepID=A0AAD6T2D2_9AGAR|nr:guanine nucleotide binding protein, alpha subunit [Mycena alexandri]